jgi:glycosyltransferase involved in cell wall biosynthesis
MLLSVKKAVATGYLRLSLEHVRRRLHRSAPRSFSKIYIVADLSRNTGIAQGARLQQAFFSKLGLNAQLLDSTAAARNPLHRVDHEKGTAYIFHCGGPQIATLLRSVLPHAADAYRIAYWAWELPAPPVGWPSVEGLVSEIWSCSEYSSTSLRAAYDLPVFTVPHILPIANAPKPRGAGEIFEVLAFADTRSSLQRKNPDAAIAAFQKAFGTSSKARLTLKLNGKKPDLAPLVKKVAQSANIRVITDYLSEADLQMLFRSSSVLLSLHRAEGFGLPIFEAMAQGLPVIATNWSGNLDYMNNDNSMLVPCSMVKIGNDAVYSNYSETSWADPDVNFAARCLQTLASDGMTYSRLSENAYKSASRFAASQRLPFYLAKLFTPSVDRHSSHE